MEDISISYVKDVKYEKYLIIFFANIAMMFCIFFFLELVKMKYLENRFQNEFLKHFKNILRWLIPLVQFSKKLWSGTPYFLYK